MKITRDREVCGDFEILTFTVRDFSTPIPESKQYLARHLWDWLGLPGRYRLEVLYFVRYDTAQLSRRIARYKKIWRGHFSGVLEYALQQVPEITVTEQDDHLLYATLVPLALSTESFDAAMHCLHESVNGQLFFLTGASSDSISPAVCRSVYHILRNRGGQDLYADELVEIMNVLPADAIVIRTFGFFDDADVGVAILRSRIPDRKIGGEGDSI